MTCAGSASVSLGVGLIGGPRRPSSQRDQIRTGHYAVLGWDLSVRPRSPRTAEIGTFEPSGGRAWGRAVAKGFGCRLVGTYPPALRAGVRKPPGKEPAVVGAVGGRLWRFDGPAGCASDVLVGGVERGCPTAAVGAKALRFSRARFWRHGRDSASV